jgi:hypothetical protein
MECKNIFTVFKAFIKDLDSKRGSSKKKKKKLREAGISSMSYRAAGAGQSSRAFSQEAAHGALLKQIAEPPHL